MIIEVNGQQVEVDDSFADLSPEQQQVELQHISSALPKAEPAAKESTPFAVQYAPEMGALGGAGVGLTAGPGIAKNIVEPIVQTGAKKIPGQAVKNYIANSTDMPFAGGKDYGTAYEKASIASGKPIQSRGSQTPIRRGSLGITTQPEPPSFLRNAGDRMTSQPAGQAGRLGSGLRMGAAGSLGGKAVQNLNEGNYGEAALQGTGALAALAGQSRYKPLRLLGNVVAGSEVVGGVSPFFTPKKPVEEKAAGGLAGYSAGKRVVEGGLEAAKKLAGYLEHTPQKQNPVVGKRFEKELVGDLIPKVPLDLEKHRGAMIVPKPWDNTSRGERIKSVSGVSLQNPFDTEGGRNWMLDKQHYLDDISGASNFEIANRIHGRVGTASRAGEKQGLSGQVLEMPITMGYEGADFSHHPSSIFIDLMRQKEFNPAVLENLSNQVRAYREPGKGQIYKNFVGYGDPRLEEQMFKGGFGLETTPGNLRKTMAHRGMLKENQKLIGFNEEDLRNAITDETLLGVPKGFGGGMFSEGRPLGALTPSQSRIYNTNNPGKYVGSSQEAPIEIWMPQPFGKIKDELSAKYPKKTGNSLRQDVIGALEKRKEGFYQPVDDQVINNIGYYQEALKEGRFGPTDIEEAVRYVYSKKEGGKIDGYAKGKIVSAAKKLILPPAENASRTQIIGTLPTYEKAGNILRQQGATGRGIDFGAGLGEGAKALGKDFDTYEPFAKNWTPTYSKAADVPSDEYGQLTNLNVLNVVPREVRDEIVQDIGRVMQPGGMGIITTRGKDVMNAKGLAGPEPMSVITSRDTYQKGFNKDELEEYLKYMLGDNFEIGRLNLGPAGAMIKKKAEGGLACMKEGGSTPAWQRAEGKNPSGGLNAAGRASYNRETGGNLKAPQPEGGSRKKSFCARMSGMKKKLTSSETANDPDSRINKSLRKWKC